MKRFIAWVLAQLGTRTLVNGTRFSVPAPQVMNRKARRAQRKERRK